MDLREKRRQELDSQMGERRDVIIQSAIEVFKEKGIDNAKMTDIADRAQVGIATLYRYFKPKSEIVIAAATWIWNEEMSELNNLFNKEGFIDLKPIDRVRKILEVAIDIYHKHPDVMSFLEQFDNYVVKEQVPAEKLEGYEKSVINMKYVMHDAISKGKEDGSIKESIDTEMFYITITHSLMSLSQKLILRGKVLNSDILIKGDDQIGLLIDMAVNYLKK